MSVYGVAATGPKLREVAVFNSTAVACVYELVTLTTAGTQGTGLTEGQWDPDAPATQCTAFHAHSSTPPTIGQRLGILFPLAATIGAGVIRVFDGLRVPKGTANGFGLVVHAGTGQLCYVDFSWDE
jgi:hypothetical protein